MTGKVDARSAAPVEAWYRQFWPWFVFGLPALAVVAGIITVILAVRNPVEVLEQDKGTASTDLGAATGAVHTALRAADLA